MKQLSTNRTVFSFLFPSLIANDLNTIINQADGKVTKFKDVGEYTFFSRLNWELERRGLDYRIPQCYCKKSSLRLMYFLFIPAYIAMFKAATAMNILSDDYNKRG